MSSNEGILEQVFKPGAQVLCDGRKAKVLAVRNKVVGSSNGAKSQVYLHFEGQDPRYDDWKDVTANLQLAAKSQKSRPTGTDSLVAEASGKTPAVAAAAEAAAIAQRGKKRPLHTSPFKDSQPSTPLAARRVNLVYFGWHEINCWYDSPYPIQQLQALYPDPSTPAGTSTSSTKSRKLQQNVQQQQQPKSRSAATSTQASTSAHATPPVSAQTTQEASTGRSSRSRRTTTALTASSAAGKKTSGPEAKTSKRRKGQPDPTQTAESVQKETAELQQQQLPAAGSSKPSQARQALARNHTEHFDGIKLYVCDGCLKYMLIESVFTAHRKSCTVKHPPGRKVYQRGGHIIWEVDGAKQKLWCQGLALLGKLFIDHKYVIYDVEGFLFYVLTEGLPSKDYIMGFFSKEKRSYDYYNLACIVTLPPYQNRGYARLMIEMSYALSTRTNTPVAGTPERPLSDLGLRTYVAFWVNVLVRYFRQQFATLEEQQQQQANGDETSTLQISLGQVADACGLRQDDVAVALERCGLAKYRRSVDNTPKNGDDQTAAPTIQVLVTPDALNEVAASWKVKPAFLQEEYLLL